eukprot:7308007-Prymnesium_polylepis.1
MGSCREASVRRAASPCCGRPPGAAIAGHGASIRIVPYVAHATRRTLRDVANVMHATGERSLAF